MTDKFISLATGILTVLCAFWVYYRMFRGTGLNIGVIVSVLLGLSSFLSPVVGKILAFTLFLIGIVFELIVNTQKREYAHSQFIYEGGGIRRGLIPVEVGVIFKLEFRELFVLALIDLLHKGYVVYKILPDGGIVVFLSDEFKFKQELISPKLRKKARMEIAFSKLRQLTDTEDALIELIANNSNHFLGSYSFQPWVDYLDRNVERKVSGYDIDQTRKYFQGFIGHRLRGVEEGHFDPQDYFGWMVLGMFLNDELSKPALGIIKNSHPDWLIEGESFINWLTEVNSIAW